MEEVVFVNMKISDLHELIKKAVDDGINNNIERLKNPAPVLIDGDTLCSKFGITKPTLQKWRDRKEIPFIQIDGVIRYDFNKIIQLKETKRKR